MFRGGAEEWDEEDVWFLLAEETAADGRERERPGIVVPWTCLWESVVEGTEADIEAWWARGLDRRCGDGEGG